MTEGQTPEDGMRFWEMRLIPGSDDYVLIAPDGEVAFEEELRLSEDFAAFVVNGQNGWLQARDDLKAARARNHDAASRLAVARGYLERIANGEPDDLDNGLNEFEMASLARDALAALDKE